MHQADLQTSVPYVVGGTVDRVRKTTIYLPPELESRLARTAERSGRSRAALIREALADYLDSTTVDGALPPSVGMGDNPATPAASYRERLERGWSRR